MLLEISPWKVTSLPPICSLMLYLYRLACLPYVPSPSMQASHTLECARVGLCNLSLVVPSLLAFRFWSLKNTSRIMVLKDEEGGVWYLDSAFFFYVHYQFYCTISVVQYMQLHVFKKILKGKYLFVFLISKGMSYLLFKCINEDLTLHQMECFSYKYLCMYV